MPTASAALRCPVCEGVDWLHVRDYVYHRDALSDPTSPLSGYDKLRQRVLFEVWYRDHETVWLHLELCLECGFVTYVPRPSAAMLDAKYRFLQEQEDLLGGTATSELGRRMDRRRAERTLRAIPRGRVGPGRRVLDFGGGNGKVVEPFHEAGAECFLLDYNVQPLPWIRRLGATLEDLRGDERFDVIVCSHILEHVGDPTGVLDVLRRLLSEGGMLYGEVPVEVWRGVPMARDPVTHVNFFTLGSFEQLFVRRGYRIVSSVELRGSYAEVVIPVACVVAGVGAGRGPSISDPVTEARRRLFPDGRARLQHLARTADQAYGQAAALIGSGGTLAGACVLLGRVLDASGWRRRPRR
jgi:SAM-dependent methyltransferase